MRLSLPPATLSLLLLAALLSCPSGALADETTELQARGKALRYTHKTTDPPSRIDTGGAAIFVDAPLQVARKIATDYRHYSKFVKGFSQSRLISREKGVSEVYFEVPVLHGAATIRAVVLMDPPVKDGACEKIAGRYKSGNVSDFRTTWRLCPVDEARTIVKLEILVDPKLPVPSSLVARELSAAADRGVTAVRREAQNLRPPAVAAAAPEPATPDAPPAAQEEKPSNVARR
jgi:ribosome-associated toxin RatA of RatAB toxin-antitoxin module